MDIEEQWEEVDILVELDLQTLEEDYERVVIKQERGMAELEIGKVLREEQIKRGNYRERKELRLGFKSDQLRKRFQEVILNAPGREKQAEHIFDFISMSENGSTATLCLYGNTGCGKTSLIVKVLDFFGSNFHTVRKVYLNCMNMLNTGQIYGTILSGLFGLRQRNAVGALDNLLNGEEGGDTKLVVLDQIDQFIGDQKFLYNLSQWTHRPNAKLVLIIISNVMDLTLRLPAKVQSRIKFQTVIFRPYTYQEVQRIIYYKYRSVGEVFDKKAVTYIAKKIANVNSDIRVLERVYEQGVRQAKKNRAVISLSGAVKMMEGEANVPDFLKPYEVVMSVLNKAQRRSEVSQEIAHRMFSRLPRLPETQQIVYLLCQLQDYGLIQMKGRRTADVMFQNLGIKVSETLKGIVSEKNQKGG